MLMRMRKPNSESGQALIMAVLVMLIVAVLAALFLAVIASQLRQSLRHSLVIALREIAEAGLRYADWNLVNGPDGADWRPAQNPGEFAYGLGKFRLTVTYEPEAGDPYSRFIKLESVARLTDNPFLERRLVAYKPILVTDYARFVHALEKNPAPASLGASVGMYLYEDATLPWPERAAPVRAYKTVIDGPVRVNTDLVWHGEVLVNISANKADNVAVAGEISHDVMPRTATWNDTAQTWLWDGPPSEVRVSFTGGVTSVPVLPSDDPAFTTVGGHYRDGRAENDAAGDPRYVRYLDPPTLSRERYLTLTRDSGTWLGVDDDGDGTVDRQVNTGWFGYGKGIYIDNAEHIKAEHNYDAMRSEWVGATAPYEPSAVVIEFWPGGPGGAPPPELRLTWRGGSGQFQDRTGANIGGSLILPFPQNGVIFATGDLAVRGTLPPRIGSPTHYYDDDSNRNYDLTIVSGGNIFIEGNVLSPVTAQLPGATADTDTKLALLARDSVVFNTTNLQQIVQPTTQVSAGGVPWYEVRPDWPLDVVISTASMDPISIYLKHTGQPNVSLPTGRAGAAVMQVLINGVPYPDPAWDRGSLGVYSDPTKYYLFEPTPLWRYNNETNAVFPAVESIPNTIPNTFGQADKRIEFAPTAVGEPQIVRFTVTADSPRFYWVRDIRARVDVEIDAALYAEHGSWYIIPGSWPTAGPEPTGGDPDYDPDVSPLPGEPMDIRITVRGAVSENRTAPLGDVNDWTAKWRGSDEGWLPTSPNYNPDLEISKFTLRYLYDSSLRRALVPGDPSSPPRLPKLPVSPAMIAWGERI
jgi:type II secretory pathway pseudopilin PulG